MDTILQSNEDEKLWQLYLAKVSNPFTEGISFVDFKEQCKNQSKPKIGISDSDMTSEITKANALLLQFKPPQEREV